MGVARSYEIYCDICGNGYDGNESTLTVVRKLARADGWKTGAAGDMCPGCRAKGGKRPAWYRPMDDTATPTGDE